VPKLHRLWKRLPFYDGIKRLAHHPDYWYWKLRGEPPRTPHLVKQRAVREYARRYGLRTLVETGTYYGEMVAAMRGEFDHIYSIEFDAQLAAQAQKKFAAWPHIRILAGKSEEELPKLVATLAAPCLFWLDAGYYGWAGAQGQESRIRRELDAILSHRVPGHVILMDDARGFNTLDGAASLADIERYVLAAHTAHKFEVKHDIVRITPA
jgi:hypothetical protein